jgi:hypothetical protein
MLIPIKPHEMEGKKEWARAGYQGWPIGASTPPPGSKYVLVGFGDGRLEKCKYCNHKPYSPIDYLWKPISPNDRVCSR